jgi:hypothetical protein
MAQNKNRSNTQNAQYIERTQKKKKFGADSLARALGLGLLSMCIGLLWA